MWNEITQGDNGTLLKFTIKDGSQIVDITGATVEATIKYKRYTTVKQCTITDGINGKCELVLDSTNTAYEGTHSFQLTITFTNGKKFTSDLQRYVVKKKIGISTPLPPNQLMLLDRLGINEAGKLTIDGVELSTSSGGEEILLVTKDYFEGSSNITKTYTEDMIGFEISNDHATTGLTFTINGLTIPVRASEVYTANFAPYKSVTINTTVPYRATVSAKYTTVPTQPDTTAPNEVSNLATSNITATSLTLSWTASTSTDVSGYEVYNGTTLLSTVTGTTYNVGSLSASTTYTFRVKVKDTSNNVSTGVTVNATTSNVADTTAPSPISSLTVGNVTSSSIPITWSVSPSSDVSNQEVAYSLDGGTTYTVASGVVNPSSTSYTINGLTASTNYTVRVVAIDSSNNRSTAVTATTTTSAPADTTAPNNVTNLTSSNITQTGVTLTWTASTSTDVASYDILNGTTLLGNVTGATYNVTGLTSGTSYTFWVKAKDASGNVASGTSIGVTTSAVDTTAPTLTITPAATFADTQQVTMSTNETATIYYTTDGTTPTVSSSVYSTALTLSVTTTLKAFAKDTAGNESSVQTVVYTKESVAWVTSDLVRKWDNLTTQSTITNDGSYFPTNSGFTVVATLKPKAYMNLLSQYTIGGTNNSFRSFLDSTAKRANINSWGTGSATFSNLQPSTDILMDTALYYHVVMMRDTTLGKWRIFVNDVLYAETATPTTYNLNSNNTESIKVGEPSSDIKNLLYYNRVLTTEELTQNYNALK